MTITGVLPSAVAIAVLLVSAACAERGAVEAPSGSASPQKTTVLPDEAGGLVLRVEYTGGFLTPALITGRLPVVSVYADGRVISEGPVAAIHPGPAWPNLQVTHLDAGEVQDLVDRALAAGVGETADLGSPPVADVPSTRFTVVTADETIVREVYALGESDQTPGGGLTDEQVRARARLGDLLSTMVDATGNARSGELYRPEAVAALLSPWIDSGDGLSQPAQPWPGPAVPPDGGPLDLRCVSATGAQASALTDAARAANANTPWTTPDGAQWTVVFRPLLPDETGCADLSV
jgi:hypothetical protein